MDNGEFREKIHINICLSVHIMPLIQRRNSGHSWHSTLFTLLHYVAASMVNNNDIDRTGEQFSEECQESCLDRSIPGIGKIASRRHR